MLALKLVFRVPYGDRENTPSTYSDFTADSGGSSFLVSFNVIREQGTDESTACVAEKSTVMV